MLTFHVRSICAGALAAATSVLILARGAVAQTADDGALWAMAIAQGKFGDKDSGLDRWRWWLDVQVRYRDEAQTYDSSFFRPGVGYALNDQFVLHLGYAFIESDPATGDEVRENRAWQQLIWNAPVDGFTLQSRTRLEERFVVDEADTGWRLRELVKATVPLVDDKSTFLSIWDEAFWDLDDTDWGQRTGFRQNRAFAGIGQFLNEKQSMSVEVGYCNQWLDRPGEDRLNHILLLAFFVTF